MRDINWLYQQLGRAHAEILILREELSAANQKIAELAKKERPLKTGELPKE